MYSRTLSLAGLLAKRSHFLFGPRATGKSTLLRTALPAARVYDLLDAATFQRLLREPRLMAQETAATTLIVIDEVQKLPALLDEVHRLIEARGQRFLLTGSSARKLRRGGSNLLAGRAFMAELMPLTYVEIEGFDLITYLNSTGLPEFYGHPLAAEFLRAYVGTYLREEVLAESLTRNLPAFARFLDVMALTNGQEFSPAGVASDCGVPVRTLESYVSILEDTLVAFRVPAFCKSVRRKAVTRAKLWLFDVGVVNSLARRGSIEMGSELFGPAFEHFIALELRAFVSYARRDLVLQHWRSTSQFEVDFVLGDRLAIEVKGTDLVADKHLKGLRALAQEGVVKDLVAVSCDPVPRTTSDGIHILPWRHFLDQLWQNNLI